MVKSPLFRAKKTRIVETMLAREFPRDISKVSKAKAAKIFAKDAREGNLFTGKTRVDARVTKSISRSKAYYKSKLLTLNKSTKRRRMISKYIGRSGLGTAGLAAAVGGQQAYEKICK